MSPFWLLPIGFGVGAIGTLLGAGGGFLLVPILILFYPQDPSDLVTSISLAVVFLNAASGTLAYAHMRRIDYRSGLMFAAASIPGALLGAWTTAFLPRHLFDSIFGIGLALLGVVLLLRGAPHPTDPGARHPGGAQRVIVEADGTRHEYSFRPWVGIALSVVIGYASSLLGIGGGIIHVPVLIYLLDFPAHIATATSHFILAFMALAATAVHLARGTLAHGLVRVAYLGTGALVGAQVGAAWSRRAHGSWIVRGLAFGLFFMGVRIVFAALRSPSP